MVYVLSKLLARGGCQQVHDFSNFLIKKKKKREFRGNNGFLLDSLFLTKL